MENNVKQKPVSKAGWRQFNPGIAALQPPLKVHQSPRFAHNYHTNKATSLKSIHPAFPRTGGVGGNRPCDSNQHENKGRVWQLPLFTLGVSSKLGGSHSFNWG